MEFNQLNITKDLTNLYGDCSWWFPINTQAQILTNQYTYVYYIIILIYCMMLNSFQQCVINII